MNFRYISPEYNKAKGRFVGPVAFLEHAKELLPELKSIRALPSEWRGWVDLIEGSGVLKPVLRWRIPTPVLQRLYAENDDCEPTGDASNTTAAEGAQILHAFGTVQSRWGKPNTPKIHPLDDLRGDAAMFIEDVNAAVWTSSTYNPNPPNLSRALV